MASRIESRNEDKILADVSAVTRRPKHTYLSKYLPNTIERKRVGTAKEVDS